MTYLRLENLDEALLWFEMGWIERAEYLQKSLLEEFLHSDHPGPYLALALFYTRFGLYLLLSAPVEMESLRRKPITPAEFYNLDDLLQTLLSKKIASHWPSYDIVGNDYLGAITRGFEVDRLMLKRDDKTNVIGVTAKPIKVDDIAQIFGPLAVQAHQLFQVMDMRAQDARKPEEIDVDTETITGFDKMEDLLELCPFEEAMAKTPVYMDWGKAVVERELNEA